MQRFACGGETKVCRDLGIQHCAFAVESGDEDEVVKRVQTHMKKQHGKELSRDQVLKALA